MAKKIVPQEVCLMCGGEGYVLSPSTIETADVPVPCPMCSPRKITKPRPPDDV